MTAGRVRCTCVFKKELFNLTTTWTSNQTIFPCRHFNEVDSSLRESTWNILLEGIHCYTTVLKICTVKRKCMTVYNGIKTW